MEINNKYEQNRLEIESMISSCEELIHSRTGVQVKLALELIDNKPLKDTVEQLLKEVAKIFCKEWNISIYEVFSKKRSRHLVAMRQIIFLHIRTRYPSVALKKIGEVFGGYDHTTIMYNIAAAKDLISLRDELFLNCYQQVAHLFENEKV